MRRKDLIMSTLLGGGSSGGGGGTGGGGAGDFTTGTFTLAENTKDYQLAEFEPSSYKNGMWPNFVFIRRISDTTAGDYSFLILASSVIGEQSYHVGIRNLSSGITAERKQVTATHSGYTSTNAGINVKVKDGKGTIVTTAFAYTMVAGTYAYIFGDLD